MLHTDKPVVHASLTMSDFHSEGWPRAPAKEKRGNPEFCHRCGKKTSLCNGKPCMECLDMLRSRAESGLELFPKDNTLHQ